MSVRWASLGGWSFASRSFSWDAEGETRLPEVLSQVLIKGASGFHLRGGTVSVHLPDSTHCLPFFLSLPFMFSGYIYCKTSILFFFNFHHEMMGKSINQFWRTSGYLKPRVCSTKVKQRNQRIQNTLTL